MLLASPKSRRPLLKKVQNNNKIISFQFTLSRAKAWGRRRKRKSLTNDDNDDDDHDGGNDNVEPHVVPPHPLPDLLCAPPELICLPLQLLCEQHKMWSVRHWLRRKKKRWTNQFSRQVGPDDHPVPPPAQCFAAWYPPLHSPVIAPSSPCQCLP